MIHYTQEIITMEQGRRERILRERTSASLKRKRTSALRWALIGLLLGWVKRIIPSENEFPSRKEVIIYNLSGEKIRISWF